MRDRDGFGSLSFILKNEETQLACSCQKLPDVPFYPGLSHGTIKEWKRMHFSIRLERCMKCPRIYEFFVSGQLVTIAEMKEKLGRTGNTLRKRLSELSAKGYLLPIRQGLYMVCSVAERRNEAVATPFAIASRVSPNACVGYKAALQFHAEVQPKACDRITIFSDTKFNAFVFSGLEYTWCQNSGAEGTLVFRSPEFGPNIVRVTSVERSIIDCLRRPGLGPNLVELISLSTKFSHPPDYTLLLHMAHSAGTATVFNRLGLYLESMAGHWEVPATVISFLAAHMSRKTCEWTLRGPIGSPQSSSSSQRSGAGADARPSAAQIDYLRMKWRVHDTASASANSAKSSPRSAFTRTEARALTSEGRRYKHGFTLRE